LLLNERKRFGPHESGEVRMIINRQTTAIVVDSTADLPESMAADPNVTMVPLTVFFGEQGFLDWVEIQPKEFYEKLAASPQLPRTSQPSAGSFVEEYKRLRQKYERVYSVHLSSHLSGTIASAEVARGQIDGVEVVDSEVATCGVSLLVDRLLALMDKGVPEEEFKSYIEHFVQKKLLLFIPTTLDQLAKGGRIGKAQHLMGTLLNVKPVLIVTDGVVDVHKKVRGMRQGLEALRDAVIEGTEPGKTVYVALAHGLNEEPLAQLRQLFEEVTDRKIDVRLTTVVGAVIGTYAGPGAVAVAAIQ
jgi:DegV family protein with EDD domain